MSNLNFIAFATLTSTCITKCQYNKVSFQVPEEFVIMKVHCTSLGNFSYNWQGSLKSAS